MVETFTRVRAALTSGAETGNVRAGALFLSVPSKILGHSCKSIVGAHLYPTLGLDQNCIPALRLEHRYIQALR